MRSNGCGTVDDGVLRADRLDGVGEREPARDLLAEEEPDHLALAVRLVPARNDDEPAPPRALDRLERPPNTLWSVTAIAPSPSASAWSRRSSTSVEQSCDQLVCMCRSATIQSRSSSGAGRGAAVRRRFVTAA